MSTIPPRGFVNTGNICYFSALVQCLLSSAFFVRYVSVREECRDLLFDNFFEDIQRRGKWDEYFTTRLLETMPGGKLPNQSSSEYLLLLIERMHMDPLFEYVHLVRSTCISCGHISETTDKSTLLLLTNNMLEFFEHSETIEGVSCDKCHNKDGIKQDRFLRSIPPLIAVSLNKYFEKTQFYYPPYFKIDVPSGRTFEGHKSPEENNVIEYTLVATLDHSGVLGGGHYVARVKRQHATFLISDSTIIEIPELNCVDSSYMLFYERKQ